MGNVVLKSFYSVWNIAELCILTFRCKLIIIIIWHKFLQMLYKLYQKDCNTDTVPSLLEHSSVLEERIAV